MDRLRGVNMATRDAVIEDPSAARTSGVYCHHFAFTVITCCTYYFILCYYCNNNYLCIVIFIIIIVQIIIVSLGMKLMKNNKNIN